MDRNSFLYKFFISMFGTVIFFIFYGDSVENISDYIIIFIITFLFMSLWILFTSNFIKQKVITKTSDEIDHPVTQIENTLHVINIQKHYGNAYDPKLLETCSCGSTMFRIYNEDTDKGTYIQFICVKCNQKATGLEFNWKEQPKV